jgi:hypothetical protein
LLLRTVRNSNIVMENGPWYRNVPIKLTENLSIGLRLCYGYTHIHVSWPFHMPALFLKKVKPGNKNYTYIHADVMTLANTYFILEKIQSS